MSITGAEAGFAVMPQVVPASKAETGESRKSLKLHSSSLANVIPFITKIRTLQN